jgi:hypothetical protein
MASQRMNDFKARIQRNKTNKFSKKRQPVSNLEKLYTVISIVRGSFVRYKMVNLETVRNLRREEQLRNAQFFLVYDFITKEIVKELSFDSGEEF